MDNIEQIFKKLPRDLQEEALDFIKFLIEKHQKKAKRKPSFEWSRCSQRFTQ
jgi:hypothetical protein